MLSLPPSLQSSLCTSYTARGNAPAHLCRSCARAAGQDQRHSSFLMCQGRAKGSSKHHFPFSCLNSENLQVISQRGFALRAFKLHPQLCSSVFSVTLQGPLCFLGPSATLLCKQHHADPAWQPGGRLQGAWPHTPYRFLQITKQSYCERQC